MGKLNELELLDSHKQNSKIVKSKNGAAKSNERMFMPFYHVMHARSFDLMASRRACLLRFCVQLENLYCGLQQTLIYIYIFSLKLNVGVG